MQKSFPIKSHPLFLILRRTNVCIVRRVADMKDPESDAGKLYGFPIGSEEASLMPTTNK